MADKINSLIIEQNSDNPKIGKIILDGEDISNRLSGVSLYWRAGELPILHLTYAVRQVIVTLDGVEVVKFTDGTRYD